MVELEIAASDAKGMSWAFFLNSGGNAEPGTIRKRFMDESAIAGCVWCERRTTDRRLDSTRGSELSKIHPSIPFMELRAFPCALNHPKEIASRSIPFICPIFVSAKTPRNEFVSDLRQRAAAPGILSQRTFHLAEKIHFFSHPKRS